MQRCCEEYFGDSVRQQHRTVRQQNSSPLAGALVSIMRKDEVLNMGMDEILRAVEELSIYAITPWECYTPWIEHD